MLSSQVFKKEVKDSYDSLVLYTQYDSIITKQTISEKNVNEIKQFVLSNNITNINFNSYCYNSNYNNYDYDYNS